MRSLFGSLAPLLVMLVIGCNAVDADECWPNTSGGFGGGGTIPIAAGVGATTSGDFISPPPGGPLEYGGDPNPCMAGGTISFFGPSDFPFVTIVADDGTGPGGGFQETKAGLIFGNNAQGIAACTVRIGMPLRSYAWGRVPPNIAPIYTAKVANAATKELYNNGGTELPPGIFCRRFKDKMTELWPEMYKDLGAKMMDP